MKSLTLSLVTLLTTLVTLLWLCERFAQMQPIVNTSPQPMAGTVPYTKDAKQPLLTEHRPRCIITTLPKPPASSWNNANLPSSWSWNVKRLPDYQPGQQTILYPLAMNRHRQIVGYWHTFGSGAWLVIQDTAFLWQRGRMQKLVTLPSYQITHAVSLNDRGGIVGDATIDSFPADMDLPSHAVCWISEKIHDLGTGEAADINNSGDIVGNSGTGPADYSHIPHALLWTHGYRYDLNDCVSPRSGWVLTEATQIDEQGRIIGSGIYRGKPRAFLLTPQ